MKALEHETEEESIARYQSSLLMVVTAFRALEKRDFRRLISEIDKADAIGPMLDPTLYREKMNAMRQDRRVFEAGAAFVAAMKQIEQEERPL